MRRVVFGLGAAQGWRCAPCLLRRRGPGRSVSPPGRGGRHRLRPGRCPPRRWFCRCSPSAGQLKTQYGRGRRFGILLFQDLAVLPALALLPLLAAAPRDSPGRRPLGGRDAAEAPGGDRGGSSGGGAAAAAAGAARRGRRVRVGEVFTAARRSSTGHRHRAARQPCGPVDGAGRVFSPACCSPTASFRQRARGRPRAVQGGCLLGLFFVSVGMSANLGLLKSEPLTVLELTAAFPVRQDRRGDRLGEARPPARRLGPAAGVSRCRRAGGVWPSCCSTLAGAPAHSWTPRTADSAHSGRDAVDDVGSRTPDRARVSHPTLARSAAATLRRHRGPRGSGDHRRLRALRPDRGGACWRVKGLPFTALRQQTRRTWIFVRRFG